MTRKVIKKSQAYRDVAELGKYLSQESLDAAIRFADAFDSTCEALRANPSLGTPWETDNEKYRDLLFWPIQGFPKVLLFFRRVSGGVEILRVCHASRDLEPIL